MRIPRIVQRIGLAMAVSAVITPAGLATVTPTAQAAGTCTGGTCTGKLPTDTYRPDGRALCATDARTFRAINLTSTKANGTPGSIALEMRYSPACNAIWARVAPNDTSSFYGELSTWIPGQASQKTWIDSHGNGNWFTPMIRGGSDVTNCMGMQIWEGGTYREWKVAFCA